MYCIQVHMEPTCRSLTTLNFFETFFTFSWLTSLFCQLTKPHWRCTAASSVFCEDIFCFHWACKYNINLKINNFFCQYVFINKEMDWRLCLLRQGTAWPRTALCGDTQPNAVHCTGDFRAQAIKGIETVAGGINLEAWHVENDLRLLEGWGGDTLLVTIRPAC
jgi:hypothetical protein